MAGKPKPMSQIKQLILLQQQGKGIKAMARILGISKNTVKAYLAKLDALKGNQEVASDTEGLLKLEAPELEARFHPGNPAYKDLRYEHFKEQSGYLAKELERKGVHKKLLWQEYKDAYAQGYSYSQFCFHLQQHQLSAKPSAVLEHIPAEKLYIDFAGKKLAYINRDTGELIDCQVFVACLPFSDYGFAMAVHSQKTADFLHALSCCLIHLGGVPKVLVSDNLKAAVSRASPFEPDINRAMEELANHYGATVLPTRARKPKDKALVENQVKLLYARVYARLRNMQFFDLHSLNQAISEQMKKHNQTRMQQKPWCREERFLSMEKGLLSPLPPQAFELKNYCELKVAKNNHVYLSQDKHYYSVPYQLIGLKTKVLYTRTMVYVYCEGKQVCVHIRNYSQGGYSTNKAHLCSQHLHYIDRSPDYYKGLAGKHSSTLACYFDLLFAQNKYPEQLYKTCDGLLSLSRKSDPGAFELACKTAIDNQVYSYAFIKNILENKMAGQQGVISEKKLPDHGNLRGRAYYQS